MLYETCEAHNIPYRKIGKLIIATTTRENSQIEQLFHNARENGNSSVSLLGQEKVRQMEPNITAVGAVYSPETGIINAHALMDYYLHDAEAKGADIVYGTEVVELEKITAGYKVATLNRAGERFEFESERVVNAAGLYSDDIAGMLGKKYSHHYCKGDYFSIKNVKKGTVKD